MSAGEQPATGEEPATNEGPAETGAGAAAADRGRPASGSGRRSFGIALAADLVGAAGVLLIAGRAWQTIRLDRPRPLTDEVVAVSGRTLDAAANGLALVALAGIVAVLATRGLVRRLIGVILALDGALLGWRAIGDLSAVSAARARQLVTDASSGVGIGPTEVPRVAIQSVWPILAISCAVLVLGAGALVAVRGASWSGMSSRYEAPAAGRPPADDVALWSALDRGDDPTAGGVNPQL